MEIRLSPDITMDIPENNARALAVDIFAQLGEPIFFGQVHEPELLGGEIQTTEEYELARRINDRQWIGQESDRRNSFRKVK